MQGLVKCRCCGMVWESVPVGAGYTRCCCGAIGSSETMVPTVGSTLPIGVTINGIVVGRPADASSPSGVATHQGT